MAIAFIWGEIDRKNSQKNASLKLRKLFFEHYVNVRMASGESHCCLFSLVSSSLISSWASCSAWSCSRRHRQTLPTPLARWCAAWRLARSPTLAWASCCAFPWQSSRPDLTSGNIAGLGRLSSARSGGWRSSMPGCRSPSSVSMAEARPWWPARSSDGRR